MNALFCSSTPPKFPLVLPCPLELSAQKNATLLATGIRWPVSLTVSERFGLRSQSECSTATAVGRANPTSSSSTMQPGCWIA
jgi:hypothetical protein